METHLKYFSKLIDGKMSLCSRDIRLGDEITWTGAGTNAGETPFGYKMKHDTPLTFGKMHQNWIKVIGEISPEAVWVTEGMEFNENQVIKGYKGWSINGVPGWHSEKEFREFTTYLPGIQLINPICKIECPTCKTFH